MNVFVGPFVGNAASLYKYKVDQILFGKNG